MNSLSELGKKHKTDKYSHGFLDTYDRYLRGLDIRRVLEIGVRTGASLRMWEEYFPGAAIHGVDIDPDCVRHAGGRIEVFIGNQTDENFLQWVLVQEYDLIIDDGSHVNQWTVDTFNILFPKLAKGGIYILEDMQCSYQDLDVVGARDKWSGMKYVPDIPRQDRAIIDDLLTTLSHMVDSGKVEAVHVHKNFILVVK